MLGLVDELWKENRPPGDFDFVKGGKQPRANASPEEDESDE